MLGLSKDKRIVRAVKSEVTSVDVVVPMEEHEDGKRKMRSRKTRNKTCKRIFIGGANNEESFKGNSDLSCRPVDDCSTSSVDPCDGKLLDSSRVLLLCGKSVVDSLTEEDESLLREMKNLPFDKEGIARPCNETKCSDKPIKEGKSEKSVKNEEREGIAETFKSDANDILPRDFRSKATKFEDSVTNNILHRNSKLIEEERKYLEEIKRHYEKKKCNPKKPIKFSEELESEKLRQSHRSKDLEKERKKFRNDSDFLAIEKAVNETLKKFIELHNFQVPVEMLTTMKANIMQNLQSELSESTVQRMSLKSFFREHINMDIKKRNLQSLITGEGELKNLPNKRKTAHTFTGEENEVSRDVSEDEVKLPLRETINIEISEEQASVEPEDIRSLQKDFQECLNSIRTQLDISGSKLCSVVLEKVDISNTVEKKLKIIHDFSRGVTECIKMCQKKLELGSPEGDNVRTSTKPCDCRRSPLWGKAKVTCNQSSQTKEKRVVKNGTQTEWNVPVGDEKHPDLVPGLYRIIKAQKELGRFYLCPEELVEESDVAARETFDGCHNPESDPFPGFLLQENVKSLSRETFRSERLPENSGKLCRTFNSDCLGLNTWDVTRRESKSTFMNFFTDALDTCRVEDDNKLKEERNEEVGEAEHQNSSLAEEKEKRTDNTENCHVGCVWLWNGEKMYPGVDLKVHVEDLLREKLREILSEVKIGGSGKSCRDNLMESSIVLSSTLSKPEISRNDLELHKTQPNFRIIDDELSTAVDTKPFIFSGCRRENTNKVINISRTF